MHASVRIEIGGQNSSYKVTAIHKGTRAACCLVCIFFVLHVKLQWRILFTLYGKNRGRYQRRVLRVKRCVRANIRAVQLLILLVHGFD